jgi:hypothetical protein
MIDVTIDNSLFITGPDATDESPLDVRVTDDAVAAFTTHCSVHSDGCESSC